MKITDLDIAIGQAINWNGADGCIMDINNNTIVIEVMGEVIEVSPTEFAEQNEDLVID